MKVILAFLLTASLFGIPMIYGEMSQLINLELESSDIKISFGDVGFKQSVNGKSTIYNILDEITISGKVLNEAYLKTYINSFSIKDVSNEFAMWATPNTLTPYEHDYKVSVFYEGIRFQTTLDVPIVDQVEPIIEEVEIYQPNILIIVQHDLRVMWKDTFDISVKVFDGKINSAPQSNPFQGKLDDAQVTVTLSLDGNILTTFGGVTEFGEFKGQHHIQENLTIGGEYDVDIFVKYNDSYITQTEQLFIIAEIDDDNSVAP